MNGISLQNLPDPLSDPGRSAVQILTSLSLENFNQVKRSLHQGVPGVLGPETLRTFLQRSDEQGLDLSDAGVIAFKDRRIPAGNQGPNRGKIGPQTALLYFHLLFHQGLEFHTELGASALKSHLLEITRQGYRDMIGAAAEEFHLQPALVAGVGSRESFWGLILSPPGPAGVGDSGHGRGLMQIDDGAHEFARTGRWREPAQNIQFGCGVLADSREFLRTRTGLSGLPLLRAALAGYNAGPTSVLAAIQQGRDPDTVTTGKDYSSDVLNRAGWFQRFADFG